jgi:hypothetical protein
MTVELVTSPELDELDALDAEPGYLQWTPVITGALAATALSLILVTFAATVGLGVSSTAPTWRDASAALWLLSAVWALAVVLGAVLAGLIGAAAVSRSSPSSANTSAAEPVLSYELDRLYRAPRRPANVDLSSERAEAGRILLTASGHEGVSAEDRTYLIQQVAAATGLPAAEAERRVDSVISNAKTALTRSRRSTIILAFSLATSLLLGAAAAWAAACAGGRHRDGAPLPEWMTHSNRWERRRMLG